MERVNVKLSFSEMRINLTSELVSIGLINDFTHTQTKWRLELYKAIKHSDTTKLISLINSAPKKVNDSVLIDMKKKLSKIIPIEILLNRIEEFEGLNCYVRIKKSFDTLKDRGILQFSMPVISEDFPCQLDVWAGSDWRPEESDQDDQTFFVLGECFSTYDRF